MFIAMKKLLFISVLLFSLTARSQNPCSGGLFPTVDSLRSFINIHIRNSAINAFTNLRLNSAMVGVTQWLDCIQRNGMDSINIIDASGSDPDTIKVYRNGQFAFYKLLPPGGGSGSTESVSNAGAGYQLVKPKTGNDYPVKTIVPGTSVSLDSTANTVTINVDTANIPKTVIRAGNNITLEYTEPATPGNPDTVTIIASSAVNKIEFISLAENAIYQNDDLIGKDILHLSIEGDEIGSLARTTAYYTFNATTGTISLTNGLFAADDYVLILYKDGTGEESASSFTPDSLSNVIAWYDFTDQSALTLNTGRVAQASDKSGNGNHVTQATFGEMPAWSAASGGYVFFDSARTSSLNKTLSTPVQSNYTIYLVIRKPSTNAFVNSAEIISTNNENGSHGIQEKNMPYYLNQAYSSFDGVANIAHTANSFHYNNYILLRYTIMSGNTANWHVNDEPNSRFGIFGPGVGDDPVIDFIRFGVRVGLPTNFYLKEAIVIADTVDDGVDIAMWNYMKNKHTLPSRDYIMMIGDSHTYGIQSGTNQNKPAYVNLMERTGIPVYNNGVNGSKAYDPSNPSEPLNLNNIKSTWLAQGNPSKGYVVFSYGTNDPPATVADPAWKASYKASIQAFIDAGYNPNKIIIWSPPYTTHPSYAPQVNASATIAAEIAAEMGIKFADVRQAMIDAGLDINTVVGGDDIHGDDAIHDVIAATIAAQL